MMKKDRYVVVTWPESQQLMEQSWFDESECFLINDEMGLEMFGNAAYFVPEDKYHEMLGIEEYRSDIRDLIQIDDETIDSIKNSLRDRVFGGVIAYDLSVSVIVKTE